MSVAHSRERHVTEVRCVCPERQGCRQEPHLVEPNQTWRLANLNVRGYTKGMSLLTGGACHSWLLFRFSLSTSSRVQLMQAVRGRSAENLLTEMRRSLLSTEKSGGVQGWI